MHRPRTVTRALEHALRLAEQQEAREFAAYDRLEDVQRLLWMWVAGDFPSVDPDTDVETTNRNRITELAAILGVDLHPDIVANEMQKRADAERAADDPLCVCHHERSLHVQGRLSCRGSHRGYTCVAFEPQPIALPEARP